MYTIELENVCKSYDQFVAVDHLSFRIEQGSVFGLLGPNGAGKTSAIRMMIGITAPDSGSLQLFGHPFTRNDLAKIGYLPEERGLYKKMKVLDQLAFLGQLHGMTAYDARQQATAWCRRLDIAEKLQSRVEELSKGMQQKIQFIAALMHEPDFVIMDEPFYGLDPVNTGLLKDELLEVKKQGRTILFSTHRMDQVEKLCDAICLIDRGKAVLEGNLAEVKGRFGKNTVQIQYEGDGEFLTKGPMVKSFSNYGNYVELRLAAGADPQPLLRTALERVRVSRFELMEPSLEEIFREVVGKTDA